MKPIQTDEFITEFLNYPSYDNIRKIGSVVDGLKNSSRKVIYYCLKYNTPKPVKTAQFKAEVENKTQTHFSSNIISWSFILLSNSIFNFLAYHPLYFIFPLSIKTFKYGDVS